MSVSAWSADEVSKLIPEIRACGEGQNADFKSEFPPQAHSLAEDVAAFATSGGGKLLIGVDNNSDVVGLDPAQHDKFYHRAQGIIQHVQPKVDAKVSLCYDDGCVLVIDVAADQKEPVYYYDQRAYVRDGRTTRRATPDEVKDRVWAHPSSEHRRKLDELEHEQLMRDAELKHQQVIKHQERMQQLADDSRRVNDAFIRSIYPNA